MGWLGVCADACDEGLPDAEEEEITWWPGYS